MDRLAVLEEISAGLRSMASEIARLIATAGSIKPDPVDPTLLLASDVAATKLTLHTEGIVRAAEQVCRGVAVLRRQAVVQEAQPGEFEDLQRRKLALLKETEEVEAEIARAGASSHGIGAAGGRTHLCASRRDGASPAPRRRRARAIFEQKLNRNGSGGPGRRGRAVPRRAVDPGRSRAGAPVGDGRQPLRLLRQCLGERVDGRRGREAFCAPVPGSLGPRLAALRPRHLPSRPVPQLLPPVHHPPARPVLPAHQRAPPLTAAIRPCRERRGAGRGAGGWQWGWQGRQGWREWLNHQRLCRGQCWAERGSGGVAGGAGGAGAGVRGRDGWRACGWGGHPGVARDRGSEESIGRRRGCEQRGGIRNRQEVAGPRPVRTTARPRHRGRPRKVPPRCPGHRRHAVCPSDPLQYDS